MTTGRLLERLRALPDGATDRQMERVIWKVLAPRIFLAMVALISWHWLFWKHLELQPPALERMVRLAGSLLIFIAAAYPAIRIMRMSDDEFEGNLEAAPDR